MSDRAEIVTEVIDAAGGGAKLARKLKLQRQAVYQWRQIPSNHVLSIEKLTGIPRHRQRPDLYPDPATEAAT